MVYHSSTIVIKDVLRNYEAVLFDLDGTLVDTLPAQLETWQKTCVNFGLRFEPDFIKKVSGMPTRDIAFHLCRQSKSLVDPSTVANFAYQEWMSGPRHVEFIPATIDIFNACYGKLPIGIGTGAQRGGAEYILAKTGLLYKIDVLVSATDVKRGKPDKETYLVAARKIGIEPRHCIVFEDTEIGLSAAHSANMDCYLFTKGLFSLHRS